MIRRFIYLKSRYLKSTPCAKEYRHERSRKIERGFHRLGRLPQLFGPAVEYATDLVQRQILFWDTLRQRGNQYREQSAKLAPHVLNYSFDVIADGRTFKRPVNYILLRITPPKGVEVDPKARPCCHCRSPRRPRSRHRRLQGGQRNRRGHEGGASLLLCRLSRRTGARPNY